MRRRGGSITVYGLGKDRLDVTMACEGCSLSPGGFDDEFLQLEDLRRIQIPFAK